MGVDVCIRHVNHMCRDVHIGVYACVHARVCACARMRACVRARMHLCARFDGCVNETADGCVYACVHISVDAVQVGLGLAHQSTYTQQAGW